MKNILFCATIALFIPSVAFATNPYVANVAVAKNFVVENKRVEFDARYFQGVNGYYSLGSHLAEKRLEEQATEQNARLQQVLDESIRLQAQVDLLMKLVIERSDGPSIPVKPPEPNDPEPPAAPEPPIAQNPEQPEEEGDSSYVPTDLDKKVYDIFVKSCAKCHNPVKDNGIVLINTETNSLKLLDLAYRAEVFDRVYGVGLEDRGKARMPKGGNLSNDEVETLRLWMIEESDRLR